MWLLAEKPPKILQIKLCSNAKSNLILLIEVSIIPKHIQRRELYGSAEYRKNHLSFF